MPKFVEVLAEIISGSGKQALATERLNDALTYLQSKGAGIMGVNAYISSGSKEYLQRPFS